MGGGGCGYWVVHEDVSGWVGAGDTCLVLPGAFQHDGSCSDWMIEPRERGEEHPAP